MAVTLTSTGEYIQNRCIMGSHACIPCEERLPSCVHLSDGRHGYPGRMWQSYYIICYKHRTTVERCEYGIFDPNSLSCEKRTTITELTTTSTTIPTELTTTTSTGSPTTTSTTPTTRSSTTIVSTTTTTPDSKKLPQLHF